MSIQEDIILFSSEHDQKPIPVIHKGDTVWLSLNQISELFDRDKSVISRHIKKVFTEEELDKNQVVAFFATTASDNKTYQVEYFNLDVVLSVGYRVNSKRGSEFRKWANSVLSDYVLKGHAISNRHLAQKGFKDVYQSLDLLKRAIKNHLPEQDITEATIEIIQRYTDSWSLLFSYDEGDIERLNEYQEPVYLDTEFLYQAVNQLKDDLIGKGEASNLFGQLRQGLDLKAIFKSVEQTFEGQLLYPSVQERAAHILYFVIKNHPFIDGNKRIGCLFFLLYLQASRFDVGVINNKTLVSLALLIAQSNPNEKDILINLIQHLI